MSQHCRLTGAKPGFGHHVSYSLRRTNLRLDVDVQRKRYWVPSLGRTVTLRLSTRSIKIIDRRGVDALVADIVRRDGRL